MWTDFELNSELTYVEHTAITTGKERFQERNCFYVSKRSSLFSQLFTDAGDSFSLTNQLQHLASREEKSEQMLDCRHELDNMEAELKRIQQEVKRRLRRRRIKGPIATSSGPSLTS